MTRYYCDRCGKEVPQRRDMGKVSYHIYECELCSKCEKEITEILDKEMWEYKDKEELWK